MDKDTAIKELNTVLKGELMAAESYEMFISNVDDQRIKEHFERFRADHKEHAELLSERISSLGADPDKGTGIPGMFSQLKLEIETNGKDSGDVLRRAYYGEDKGVKKAEEIVKGDLDAESADLISNILSKDREHLNTMVNIMQNNS